MSSTSRTVLLLWSPNHVLRPIEKQNTAVSGFYRFGSLRTTLRVCSQLILRSADSLFLNKHRHYLAVYAKLKPRYNYIYNFVNSFCSVLFWKLKKIEEVGDVHDYSRFEVRLKVLNPTFLLFSVLRQNLGSMLLLFQKPLNFNLVFLLWLKFLV